MSNYYNNNNQGQQNNADDTRSYGPTFKNVDMNKFLSVSYWNSCLSITIGNIEMNGYTRTPQPNFKNATSQSITFQDISSLMFLLDEIKEEINETGTFDTKGIRCGSSQDNIIMISNGSDIGSTHGIYLAIYKKLDSVNRPTYGDIYAFNSLSHISAYDATSGAIKEESERSIKGCMREFKAFISCVEESEKAFTNAQAHAIKRSGKNDSMSTLRMLSAICSQMRIDAGNTGGNSMYGGQRSGNQGWSNNNSYNSNVVTPDDIGMGSDNSDFVDISIGEPTQTNFYS